MRLTDFWERLERQLGPTYARAWARDQSITQLGHRTIVEALDAGEDTKTVWRAVAAYLELPDSER
jgi:Protein of unknown function (DUF3046)